MTTEIPGPTSAVTQAGPIQEQSGAPLTSALEGPFSLDLESTTAGISKRFTVNDQTHLSLQIDQESGVFSVGTEITVIGMLCGGSGPEGPGPNTDLAVLLQITNPGLYPDIDVTPYPEVDVIVKTNQSGTPGVLSVQGYSYNRDGLLPPIAQDGGPSHVERAFSIPAGVGPSGASTTLIHGLGVFPQVTLLDATGLEIQMQVDHFDKNTVVLTSNVAVTGTAIFDSGFPQTTILSAAAALAEAEAFALLVAGRQ